VFDGLYTLTIMHALCPKCGSSIRQVELNQVEAKSEHGPSLRAITYSCPKCFHLLSVNIDPIAIKSDIVRAITEELKKSGPDK
jgi:hypothetical protein